MGENRRIRAPIRSTPRMLQGVMVNSGSSADLMAAFGLVDPLVSSLQVGDEVLVPSVTWPPRSGHG